MPNPTLTPTITDLARELADLCPMKDVFPGCRCKECRRAFAATALANLLTYEPAAALASPPVEAAQGEALPCPFCGQPPRVMDEEGYGAQVFCGCDAEPLVARSHGELPLAIASWNRRTPAAPEARR